MRAAVPSFYTQKLTGDLSKWLCPVPAIAAKAGSGSQALPFLVWAGGEAGAKVPGSSRKWSITSP